ncbi:hypothetical protein [Sphingobium sp. CAP-1]|uniref:hypothetical protein n=1 Tax=Sphingobium sp. CAP-1 TaxID=2676077 RepID=UPI0012BB3738|nr:hypothetical protein [Sphingobium sp. CAP-1]QGP79149.1 hypothetical protein GL174_09175 [Sphingobium sp. CAP-1]
MTEGWIALFMPLLLWAQAVWASPFLKTYRHGPSALLSIAAGSTMFAALFVRSDYSVPLIVTGTATMVAMFFVLLWPKKVAQRKRRVR